MGNDYEKLLDYSLFFTKQELLDTFGPQYELRIKNALTIKDENLFLKYKTENLISIESDGKTVEASEDLLVDLINNPAMFGYLLSNMDNPVGIAVQIYYFDESGNLVDNIMITKADICKLLKQVDQTKFKTHTFLPLIESMTSEEALIKKYEKGERNFYVDGKNILIQYSALIEILFMSANDFNDFIKTDPARKEKIFMLINFMEKERILSKYNLSPLVLDRYNQLKNNKLVDIEAINYDRKMEDPDNYDNQVIEQVVVDDALFNEVTKGIKKTYSKLEIAIHIYIKLCEVLTLDQSYYASSKTGEDLMKHSDISQVNNINLEDNEVVCYEFTLLYAAILKQFGINYKIVRNSDSLKNHTYLNMRINDFIIDADAVRSINDSDVTNVKLNSIINGLVSKNENRVTRDIFKEKVNQIYKNILNDKKIKVKFYEALNEYAQMKQLGKMPLKESVLLITEGILRSDLKGIDNINYMRQMFDIAFKSNENISYTFLSSKINPYKNFDYTVITLLTIKDKHDYKYFVIDANDAKVEEISKGKLYERMFNKDYAYISASSREIEGLGLESVSKYVR